MDDYITEPRLVFKPLSHERYCEFYELEMSSFSSDFEFYKSFITANSKLLELGCGTGRLTHMLSNITSNIMGLDISAKMIEYASGSRKSSAKFSIGDMRHFEFDTLFDTIIIPYNTLNLLLNPADIGACLSCCYSQLIPGGQILLQLFVPDDNLLTSEDASTFQFQIFEKENYGKIIKESIKKYNKNNQTLTLTERYRLRPTIHNCENEELIHKIPLLAFHANKWLDLIKVSNFMGATSYGNYQIEPFEDRKHSCLLIRAFK